MLAIPSAAVVLLSAIAFLASPAQSTNASQHVSANLSCPSYQTQCALGCCPYADGVCCSDGYECCQHGQTCISYIGICIGLVNEKEKAVALVSSKATPIVNQNTPCPSSFTTCGPDKCCLFPDATCCSDGEHCCPNGYRCDIPNKKCIRNFDTNYYAINLPSFTGTRTFESFKTQKKNSYKSCPGGATQCPSYMSCCLDDNGAWGCCPNPASSEYKKKGSNLCCNTMSGYICCPVWAHACTYIGCM